MSLTTGWRPREVLEQVVEAVELCSYGVLAENIKQRICNKFEVRSCVFLFTLPVDGLVIIVYRSPPILQTQSIHALIAGGIFISY